MDLAKIINNANSALSIRQVEDKKKAKQLEEERLAREEDERIHNMVLKSVEGAGRKIESHPIFKTTQATPKPKPTVKEAEPIEGKEPIKKEGEPTIQPDGAHAQAMSETWGPYY